MEHNKLSWHSVSRLPEHHELVRELLFE
jgi:hypothetical protein